MKYQFDFTHLPDYVLISTGEFSVVEDFYKLLKDLLNSPRWQSGVPLLIDHRKLVDKQINSDDLQMIASIYEFHAERLGGARCAVIVERQMLPEPPGTARQDGLRFFIDPAGARKWLAGDV